MPSFQELFTQSKGQPIVYQGKTLVMSDAFPTNGAISLKLIFEAYNSEWRQGVSLRLYDSGAIIINSHNLKHAVCWSDTAPKVVDFELSESVPSVRVYNVWDSGNGVIDAKHNGAAMIVEELPNGRRYRCNDGEPDDDFDDIVFRIERVIDTESAVTAKPRTRRRKSTK